jgi:hypothetical protein
VNNAVIRTVGERRTEDNLKSHVDLVEMLDIVNLEKGLSLFNYLLLTDICSLMAMYL